MEGFLFRDDIGIKRIFDSSQIKGAEANLYAFRVASY